MNQDPEKDRKETLLAAKEGHITMLLDYNQRLRDMVASRDREIAELERRLGARTLGGSPRKAEAARLPEPPAPAADGGRELQLLDDGLAELRSASILNPHQEAILSSLAEHARELKEEQARLRQALAERDGIIDRQKRIIGSFRASVMYPFYRMSSAVGRTQVGKMLQKLKQ